MRSLVESTTRWQETLKHSTSLADLQRAVKDNGPRSPCISGCRSICWKVFLLTQSTNIVDWSHDISESRTTYSYLRDHFLKYIKHPEHLTADSVDPLADDADSPWNTLRNDQTLRAEILQDVQRLPDEPFYHQPEIQTLILDVLFVYCKLNPGIGGYRQGMHELLAPIVYTVEQDAIDPGDIASSDSVDPIMLEILDASFIEHDAFALFSKVMDRARSFYEVTESATNAPLTTFDQQSTTSSIVEKSQYIHEVCLFKVDPELSTHLKNIEILPQVFLIRWIRLLFSREFPFNQMLVLWDTLFSVDPSFRLIDLVCTAMLIRIRWDLLNADYTVALQLLLKYPPPQQSHGPHTFIDDAVYLRAHLDSAGGSTLITKYTGRSPSPLGAKYEASTPKVSASNIRRKLAGARSPLSPARFKPPQGGMEALLQGAAKGVLERGEKLGINQAVRDAMLEIRRNVQEARTSMKAGRDLLGEPGSSTTVRAVAMLDRRNRRLAALLDEPLTSVKSLASSDLEDKRKCLDALEIAAAKIQFIKIYLEDSTLDLPDDEEPVSSISSDTPGGDEKLDPEPLSQAVAAISLGAPAQAQAIYPQNPENTKPLSTKSSLPDPDIINIDNDPLGSGAPAASIVEKKLERPQPPIPTRSTLAQSSFSWMLEPDAAPSSSSPSIFPSNLPPIESSHRKRPSANASRERTAFLFGEVAADEAGNAVLPGDIFGMEEIRKGKS
ncbi:TBC1 domain family member 5 [Daldinia childiae]|uniref:TBC1 domain family member 5 n=1 Tax=Daldinia childiae TaxID=326645 RepID=UPI0014468ACE|nr:TBC1 domain family member 5 [Daldinia childiae]KAF3063864.1 TBC1 domain family member 5 [Daldinia childiae]